MDVVERVFELYDRIERLEKELKAEKAINAINHKALTSCEKQLGMDEEAHVSPSESIEDGQPNKCSKLAICDNSAAHGACGKCFDYSMFDAILDACGRCIHNLGNCYEAVGPCGSANNFSQFKEK